MPASTGTMKQNSEAARRPLKEIILGRYGKKEAGSEKVETLEEVLKRIDDDWKSGSLSKLAGEVEAAVKYLKARDFKANEKLTGEMKTFIEKAGECILEKDEIEEAKSRFKGAKHSYRLDTLFFYYYRGHEGLGQIELFRSMVPDKAGREATKLHEAAHYVHYYLEMKGVESGKIEDPILKKLYGYLRGAYNDETIHALKREYVGAEYNEAIAGAITISESKPSGGGRYWLGKISDTSVNLSYLLNENPGKFRELMENPSLWVKAEFGRNLGKLFES